LDLPGGNTNNGNLVWLWECSGSQHQSWEFDPGSWKITYKADPSKCLDIPGGDTKNGQRLQIWDCNGHDNQKWGYDSSKKTIYSAWQNHVKCMDVNWGDGTALHTLIQIWDCNGHTNQQWNIASGSETAALDQDAVQSTPVETVKAKYVRFNISALPQSYNLVV